MATRVLSIEELVNRTSDLPSIPEAALKVVRQANDPNSSPDNVAQTLATDQALAARLLRLANSAYYGLPRQVTSLQDAVKVLGMRTVRHLAVLASTYPWLSRSLPGYDLPALMLWRHSFMVATCAQLLARKTRHVDADEAFTAGLLHDIGKIVMSAWMEDELSALMREVRLRGCSFNEAEQSAFGFTHADVGGYLAQSWNLPPVMVEAITHHHTPQSSDSINGLAHVTHLSDAVCVSLGLGVGGDGLNYYASPTAIVELSLCDADIESAADELVDSLETNERLLDMAA